MRIFYFLFIVLLFSGCNVFGDPVEDEESANVNNGGAGSTSSPYVIGSGTFELIKTLTKTYYSFDITNTSSNCSSIIYDVYSNEGVYTLKSDTATFTPDSFQSDLYWTVNSMSAGSYTLTNSSNINSKFGFFSTCVNSLNDDSLNIFTNNKSFEIETDYELFTFVLTAESSVNFEFSGSGTYNSYARVLFDSNFDRIYSFDDLSIGTYYILIEGSSTYPPTVNFTIN